jgi:hypothetical protein
MSTPPAVAPVQPPDVAKEVPPPSLVQTEGLSVTAPLDEETEKRLDAIEMIGEEEAAGFRLPVLPEVSAGMRYLHSSRTIHQLVTDRNRAVGLYLAVASLLWTASSGILNAPHHAHLIVPMETIQRWCLPVTFGTLTVLALFTGFLLIRTRIGLIYEVAKMNVLLGLPVGRVRRVNPLSIFFIMHLLISLAGGSSGALFAHHLLVYAGWSPGAETRTAVLTGAAITVLLVVLYIGTVLHTTSDRRLQDAGK